jgi:hypothetical protein
MLRLLPLLFLVGCGAAPDAAPTPSPGGDAPPAPDMAAAGGADSKLSLGFVLTRNDALDAGALVASARELGICLKRGEGKEAVESFELEGGGHLMVARISARHPDAPGMVRTPLTPDESAIARAEAHFIVTGFALPGDLQARDALMARLLAAVVRASEAEGVMLGHGILFYKPELFVSIVAETEPGVLPVEVAVDVTVAPEGEDRMSFLSHGMQRYGREEFYIVAARDGHDALEFTWTMCRWMILDPDKQLPTGDTVGRTAQEKLLVQRVPSPTGEGPEVIKLELP